MKKLLNIFFIPFFILAINSCGLLSSDDEKPDPNVIGGETNLPINAVGNTFGASVKVGNNNVDVQESIEIVKNDNGIVTIDISADLSKVPGLSALNDMIPSTYKDANGKIKAEVPYKITSEGIQDFFNKDGKPHTLVKYDSNVGDSYALTKSDGKTITRTVTAKSDQDDFPYGYYYIKTMTVEQDSRIPGVRKIIYRANHKFGLVFAEFVLEDGSSVSSYLFTSNY